jgi:hypothetical protein
LRVDSPVCLRTCTALLALVLSICSVSHSALGQSEDYKSLTDAAVEEHSLGHYEEARALFTRAHAINPSARTFFGMGVAAFESRQYVDAIGLLEQARADGRRPLTAAQRKQTDSLLERAQAFVVRVPIRVTPKSARVTIDGRALEPDAQGTLLLDAGAHQVVISAEGYEEVSRLTRWEAGHAPPFEVRLEKREAGGSHDPALAPEPTPDRGAAAKGESAAAAPGLRTFSVLKWASLGATVAALGITGTGIALRESEATHYNDDRECPPPNRDAACPNSRRMVNKWETMAIAGGAAAGAFAALSVLFFVLDRKQRESPQRARTTCGPAFAAGALCQVRF